jgi:hydroxyacylglutathione hydrolase
LLNGESISPQHDLSHEESWMPVHVDVVETPELGNRSYVAHDGKLAVVVDPQRDLDRIERALSAAGVELGLVVETHIHHDYVSGGYELSQRCAVPYGVNTLDPVSYERLMVGDGDRLEVGRLQIRVIATPGHTDTHLSYVVFDVDDPYCPPSLFTGGSLLYGGIGRTDLVDPDRTLELTHSQFRSVRRLADMVTHDTPVFPTHGLGSFCSSGSVTDGRDSTIEIERSRNEVLANEDESAFVEAAVSGFTDYPTYYAHMSPMNRRGPRDPGSDVPTAITAAELSRRIAAGEWVIDVRDRTAFAAEHVVGSVSIELGEHFTSCFGWLVPWGAAVTLLAERTDQVRDAQRQLMRIGVDQVAGVAVGSLDDVAAGLDRASYPRAQFLDLADNVGIDVLLDVRRDDERASGQIEGSVRIPLQSLLGRLHEIPAGRLWVYCATGFRAGTAASLLARAGRDVVHVDDDYIPATRPIPSRN